MNKLHRGDRAQEEDRGDGKGMNSQPSHSENGIGDGLVRCVGGHSVNQRVTKRRNCR